MELMHKISNSEPITIIGGVNVLENEDITLEVCQMFFDVCEALGMQFIFKGSFDKANRSSIDSFRGVGLRKGLQLLDKIKSQFDILVITDVHEIDQVAEVAKIADVIQIPAFLARQTDLLSAAASCGKPLNIKKPQFMSPSQVRLITNKCEQLGAAEVYICERGSCFGYDNLVVDMLGFQVMKEVCPDIPLIFDVTHSLQNREPGSPQSGGRRSQLLGLAKAGVATGLAGLFIEAHPDPDMALCDGPSAIPLNAIHPILSQIKEIDDVVKSQPAVVLNS